MGECLPGPGFLCFRGPGRAGPRCRFCSNTARWQCDQLLDGGPLTCDAFLCARHRFVRDRGIDYCPDHWGA